MSVISFPFFFINLPFSHIPFCWQLLPACFYLAERELVPSRIKARTASMLKIWLPNLHNTTPSDRPKGWDILLALAATVLSPSA